MYVYGKSDKYIYLERLCLIHALFLYLRWLRHDWFHRLEKIAGRSGILELSSRPCLFVSCQKLRLKKQ